MLWERLLSQFFGFSLSSFHQCSMPIFIYMLLVTRGQLGGDREPSKKNAVSEIGKNWTQKHFHLKKKSF
jgi:hypothetical protein